MSAQKLIVGVVGACGSGKTSLCKNVHGDAFELRHIAQEHSYVKDMWKRITNPKFLIYLDVTYENTIKRKRLNWTRAEFDEQLQRLEHARQNADLVIDTNGMTEAQVAQKVLEFIHQKINTSPP
jgi:dephospho-CoA kinase